MFYFVVKSTDRFDACVVGALHLAAAIHKELLYTFENVEVEVFS